jgi:hypothetical protein
MLFGHERIEIVDWYHATEQVWMLKWFDAPRPTAGAAAATLKRDCGYFTSNAARMPYPTLRQQHLPAPVRSRPRPSIWSSTV